MSSPPDAVVFEQGERTVKTPIGTVTIIAPRNVTVEMFAKAFKPLLERREPREARTNKKSAPHHSPKPGAHTAQPTG